MSETMADPYCHRERPPSEELTPEIIADVKTEIQRACQSRKYIDFFQDTKTYWTDNNYILALQSTPTSLGPSDLQHLCNKPCCFYWRPAAQSGGHCPSAIIAAICKEWFRCHHNQQADVEDGHFFANPVRITPGGPTALSGILQAHRDMCQQADTLLDKIRSGNAVESRGYPWPDPRRHRLLPLARSVIIVMEEIAPIGAVAQDDAGLYLLDALARIQSVLLVRTGDESGLSAPITFETMGSTACADTVRVSLSAAVGFIADLQDRERRACADPRGPYSSVSSRLETLSGIHHSEDAVRRALLDGRESYSREVRTAIRRVSARRRGESLPDYELFQFNTRWI